MKKATPKMKNATVNTVTTVLSRASTSLLFGHRRVGDKPVALVDGDRTPRPFVESPFVERCPEFSPGGRWLAYVSDESGHPEVYVQPYPGPGAMHQISTEGGVEPSWSPGVGELVYKNSGPIRLLPAMAVDITTAPDFVAGRPHLLFTGWPSRRQTPIRSHDVAPDGRFLTTVLTEPQDREAPAPRTHITLVQN